jgi:CRP-like cAMP-binding protein
MHSRLIKKEEKGEALFKAGEHNDKFYFVLRGQLLLTRQDKVKEEFKAVKEHYFLGYQGYTG